MGLKCRPRPGAFYTRMKRRSIGLHLHGVGKDRHYFDLNRIKHCHLQPTIDG